MKKIVSGDGSVTFHHEELDESYHSRTGALEESFEKYVKPAQIKNGFRVLDVCFGLGYNTLATLFEHDHLDILGIELDEDILNAALTISVPEEYSESFMTVQKAIEFGEYTDSQDNHVNLIVGDARAVVEKLESDSFDAVLFDPFSPKKAPHMWTKEFFSELLRVMKKGSRLTTYSCARVVRDNLREAGFTVMDGPCVGRRSPSTIAVKP